MFSKFELTNDGVNLLNRVIAEKKTLKFTKFQLGKGDYEGDKKELSQLVDKFDEFNITQTNVLADGITNIKGFYDNRNLSIASKLTEIGIMAQLGDDSLTEVLFSYSNQPSTDAETLPSKESYFSRTFSVMNKTDNVTSVTFDLTIRQDKYNFGTLAEMKSADYLDVGDKLLLWGNNTLGDTPLKMYIVASETQPIQLVGNLYAKEYLDINKKAEKTVQVLAGNGLTGGGDLSTNRTINVASADEGIIVNADNIKLNIVDNYNTTNNLRPVSAKVANDLYKLIQGFNKCPYNVGDIFLTTNATNPSTVWLGTTWQKIEGRMLLGTSGSGASKATGGSNTATLSTANLPSHTHSASQSAHTHSRGTQNITGILGAAISDGGGGADNGKNNAQGAFSLNATYNSAARMGAQAWVSRGVSFTASNSWSGASSSSQPAVTVGATGSGSAFSILSSYYTVHMWLRLT